ncbi:endonuclease domain-containing 1 protein-like [Manacus candei]|uniref:endonuclease domain-containing 1 protein-like n=1 Tax=Manacus candei TaxID=415023 RepID=UPI002225E139|nr:endonuclease domain-containing 1 protein-like [Manacus candei]XP_051651212.1 endonuclease domain-containing 1 protein-like [Manacus candei]XP_051651213.1 endonuclease domain-containing 1 protein-like [Manacus candei]XP_051651214.1 endonuclease domain-containing 1 protein-like [Manacus candei]XP_051651215.1 endonuclease domain-containing 1 protein-like [Manacus candei]XP_051651216.1 endonuclease domain-containing 1 protein-like [Manacus candei]
MLWLLLLQVWASCLWLGQGEVVKSFANTCNQFFYQNMPPGKGLEPQNPAWICQTFKNKPFYATLYDKKGRIPVYSAYIYEFVRSKRAPPLWMVEPQLIRDNLPKDMETEKTLREKYSVSEKDISKSQAVYQDYLKLKGLDRGHLNPAAHHKTQDGRNATFTLTNVVPQNTALNKGKWNVYEQKTMPKKSKDCKTTYAIVGAVPGKSYITNGRVNVPSHIWASACCKTKKNTVIAWGAIAENNQNKIQVLTLGALEEKLAELYKRGQVSLFHKDCPRK